DEHVLGRAEPRQLRRGLDDPPVRPELGDADRLDRDLHQGGRLARPPDLDHRVGPVERQRTLPRRQLRLQQVHDVQRSRQHAALGAGRDAEPLRQPPRRLLPLPGARPVRDRHAERPRGVLRRAAEQRRDQGRVHARGQGGPRRQLTVPCAGSPVDRTGEPGAWQLLVPGSVPGRRATANWENGMRSLKAALLVGAVLGAAAPTVAQAASPTVLTGSVSSIATTGGTVHANVTPHGLATTYAFQYGTSSAYGAQTTTRSAGSGTRTLAVSVRIK